MLGFAVIALTLAVPVTASASTCTGRGYRISKKTTEYTVLTKTMKAGRFSDWRQEFSEPPIGTFVCSNRFHKRVYIGLDGHGVDGNVWKKLVRANYRFVAWVRGQTNNLDGGGDGAVGLADLETGKKLGYFFGSESWESGMFVHALALSPSGAIGWIEDSEERHVWLRTTGRPRLMASGPAIDARFLKFGQVDAGRGLIWSTGNSVTKSPGT